MSARDIIPLGSSCALCGRAGGERHGAGCAIGSRAGRVRVRVQAALAEAEGYAQAQGTMAVLQDAAADCDDDHAATQALMTLAEAQDAFAHMQADEATSIALDGLETMFGESFAGGGPVVGAPALSATTLTVCERALDNRLTEVEAELAQAANQRWYYNGLPIAQVRAELTTERDIIREALAELARVIAVTRGVSGA